MAAVACTVQDRCPEEGGRTPCSLYCNDSMKSMGGLVWLEHIEWREHSKPKACVAERAGSGRLSASQGSQRSCGVGEHLGMVFLLKKLLWLAAWECMGRPRGGRVGSTAVVWG